MNVIEKIISLWLRFYKEQAAAIVVVFALAAPVVVGAAGMALDVAQAFLVRERLTHALDAAALAAAASSSDEAAISQKVKDFFHANYPAEKIGVEFEPVVVINGDLITVTGYAYYGTSFLNVIGVDKIDIEATTTVQRQIKGLEVVLVMDNTGSMSSHNNIGALRQAARSFVNILYDSTANDELVKVGLVPYANSVRVGRYGLGLKPDGSDYDGEPFVTLPPGMQFTNNHMSDDWYGCVVEHNANNYSDTATHVPGSKGQLWKNGANWNGHGWNPASGSNDPYDYDVYDNYEGPWDIYSYGRVIPQGRECSDYSGYSNSRCTDCTGPGGDCASSFCYCWLHNFNHGTNNSCPYTNVMPLSSDRDELIDQIDTMQAHGYTLGNIGMAWGARVISPEPPFEEGTEWDDPIWRKAVVMMTDGDNTSENTYSTYWFRARNNLAVSDYNERFEKVCEYLKEKGVRVYTITFTSNISNNTKGYYERCATSEEQYFDAPTQDDLIEVFEKISRELSNIHIHN